jgi:hypothetical protein
MSARELTGDALAAVLGRAAEAAIDGAVARNAGRVAAAVAAVPGAPATTIRRTRRRATVGISGEGLFAREFGGRFLPADPLIAPALAGLGRRRR